MPIHILALRVAAIVTGDDAIRIDNRRHPKLKHVSQLVADYLTRQQEVEESMDDERRMSLSTVLPSNDAYDRFGLICGAFRSVCDLEQR